ncbi:endonuclease/exonuclease/phosphatase [Purpureocillium lilacinum]|uniref:Endonuclease/exonuclease/phosphatase n=1 Tax=Purpureocillium lilacinum TaxID=33203 RepID=A0A179FAV0_PURLI|nr:endonuclease/exonuclease/phosphatase [Purpureocillium lilacinum]
MSLAANAGSVVGLRGGPKPAGRRVVKRKIDDLGIESGRSSRYATRTTAKTTLAKEGDFVTDVRNGGSDAGDGDATPQHVSELLGDCRAGVAGLSEMIRGQGEVIRVQQEIIRTLKEASDEQQNLIRDLKLVLEDTKQQMGLELKRLSDKLEVITARPTITPPRFFAEVARSPHPSQPATVMHSKAATGSLAGSLYCTIDTSRVEEANRDHVQVGAVRQAIEGEMRAKDGRGTWQCAAVVRDARAAERIKVICRNENELTQVKEAAQRTAVVGTRVMRDQLYAVKVDNANKSMVLDTEGNVLPGAAEALGAENSVSIAKMSWLSNKRSGKAYGSMVIYVTKESDAKRLLDGHYFDLAGESAITDIFEPRKGPRKAHWEDFLAEDANIWKAAKYLEPGKDAMGNKVPPLKKAGGTMTRNRAEQAEQLLDTFFPPPPARIEEEGLRPQRRAVAMLALTLEEVEVKVMAAKPWKAAGTDGLPAMVLWPVVKHRALALFRASLREDVVPHQWRTAMIIPLKKPEKHRGESMATDITPVNTGQNLRSGRRGAHISV